MNDWEARSGGLLLDILGCLGCIILAVYFAFMGFVNYGGAPGQAG